MKDIKLCKKVFFFCVLLLFYFAQYSFADCEKCLVHVKGEFKIISTKNEAYKNTYHFTPFFLDDDAINRIIKTIPEEVPKGWQYMDVERHSYIKNGVFHTWKDKLDLYKIVTLIKKSIEEEGGVVIAKQGDYGLFKLIIGVEKETTNILIIIPSTYTNNHYSPVIRRYNLSYIN